MCYLNNNFPGYTQSKRDGMPALLSRRKETHETHEAPTQFTKFSVYFFAMNLIHCQSLITFEVFHYLPIGLRSCDPDRVDMMTFTVGL